MRSFLQGLTRRNPLLFRAGAVSFALACLCLLLWVIDHRQVLGINAWIKPFKFFLSIGIFFWTMGWYLAELPVWKGRRAYEWMLVLVMTFEMAVIAGQAARGQLSHFNISTPLSGLLFSLMGLGISLLTVWTGLVGLRFWRTPRPAHLPEGYWWGIRWGILLFVVFAFEGGLMAQRLQHTVGAPDGGPGWPVLNWSLNHGDLRIAHFAGMHALQVLPLLGFYLLRGRMAITVVALLYLLMAFGLLWLALAGRPLL